MNTAGPTGLVHSIQARLKNEARETGRPFAELLELFAVERFLHRLGRSEHRERFILKGALLLRHWLGVNSRPTRDIDLLGPLNLDVEGLRTVLREVLQVKVENDGIEFHLDSINVLPICVESPVLGLRAKFDARLGRVRLRYQVDAGLGDVVVPPTEEVISPPEIAGGGEAGQLFHDPLLKGDGMKEADKRCWSGCTGRWWG